MLCISRHFGPLKALTFWMDLAKLLDILTLLPVSKSILPRVMCFAMSRPANHATCTCSYISGSGYANEPIRRCLSIDYIIISVIVLGLDSMKK